MKKIFSISLTIVLMLSMLAGCSSSTTVESQTEEKIASETLETAAQKGETTSENVQDVAISEDEEVTITFAFYGSPVEKEVMTNAINEFMEVHPEINVEIQFIVTDYNTKLTTMLAGNTAPDIAYCEPELAMPWAEEGKILNVLEFLENDPDLSKEDFLPNIWYNWEDGKSIGTNSACEAYALFYNKKMTDAAGVIVPDNAEDAWTWDEFVENAKKLTIDINGRNALDPEFDPENIKQYGIQFGTGWASYMGMVYSNGGDYVNEDGTEFTLNQPEAVEAIQKMADLINVHHVAPSPMQAAGLPAAPIALQTEKIAMTMDGQWALMDINAAGVDFGIGVLPKLKKSVTLVLGAPTVIFSSTKHPEEAWELYKWLANPETSLQLHQEGLWMPVLKDWYTEPELLSKWAENNPAHPESYKGAILEQTLENGIPGPLYTVKNFANLDAIVTPALDQVWMGEKTAEEALNEIADQVNEQTRGRYGQ